MKKHAPTPSAPTPAKTAPRELDPRELAAVTGGTPSIPIPPPRQRP